MPIPDNNDGAITLGLRKLRGEVPSGDLYEKNADGRYELRARGGEHVMDVHGDRCERCCFTRVDFEDAIAPKVCTGKPPQPGDMIYENSWSIIVHLGFEDYGLPGCRDPQRWCIDKRNDIAAQWREVKKLIANNSQSDLIHFPDAKYAWVGFTSEEAAEAWFIALDPASDRDATVVVQSRLHEKDEPGEFTTEPLRYSYIELPMEFPSSTTAKLIKHSLEQMDRIDRELNEELFPAIK